MNLTVAVETYVHPETQALLSSKCQTVKCGLGEQGEDLIREQKAVAVIPGPTWQFTGSVLDRMPSLLVIGRPGIGVDAIDIEAATDRGVAVINTPDAPTVSTTEHTISLLLALAKGHKRFARLMATGQSILTVPPLVELKGKVLGLVGLGRIGKRMAQICGKGFEMKVVAFDPYVSTDDATLLGVTLYCDLYEVLQIADFVSIHCPPLDSTRGLIDADALAAMKPTAYLINCARGVIVDETALVAALREGKIAGAGLDVFDPEPSSPSNPLLSMENVVATPHSAGYTDECLRKMGLGVARQIIDVLYGRRPSNLVNPEVWDSPNRRQLAMAP